IGTECWPQDTRTFAAKTNNLKLESLNDLAIGHGPDDGGHAVVVALRQPRTVRTERERPTAFKLDYLPATQVQDPRPAPLTQGHNIRVWAECEGDDFPARADGANEFEGFTVEDVDSIFPNKGNLSSAWLPGDPTVDAGCQGKLREFLKFAYIAGGYLFIH